MPQPSRIIDGQWLHEKAGAVADRIYSAHALVYLVDGGGIYTDRLNGSRPVARGDVLCLFPDLRHSYGRGSSPRWSEVWISFSGPICAALANEGLLDRRRPMRSPGHDPALVALFDTMVTALPRATAADQPVLVAQLHRILAEIAARESAGVQRDGDLATAAMALFEEELGAPLDLPATARRLGVGYDRLRRAFTAATGRSPTRWRLERRIARARELLARGLTLADCAERLGYCDLHHFARQFKRIAGVNPGRWRHAATPRPAGD